MRFLTDVTNSWSVSSYPLSLINSFVSGGLLFMRVPSLGLGKLYNWHPPFKAYIPVIAFFFLSNVFLALAPLVPPAHGFRPYESLPYWVRRTVFFAATTVPDEDPCDGSYMCSRGARSRWSGCCTGSCGVGGCL